MTRSQTPAKSADPIKRIIHELKASSVARLREHYRELFKKPSPSAFSADLLRRVIAYRIQEDRFGGLSPKTEAAILQRNFANPSRRSSLEPPRQLAIGCVLVRDHGGHSHRVTVTKDGFEYNGKTYGNLSEIALQITGTKWNGPRFFGLRKTKRQGMRNEGKH